MNLLSCTSADPSKSWRNLKQKLTADAVGLEGQAAFNVLSEAFRTMLDLHCRRHTTEQALDNVGVILMTSGLKAELRREVLKRDVPLVTAVDIKALFNTIVFRSIQICQIHHLNLAPKYYYLPVKCNLNIGISVIEPQLLRTLLNT